jgi:hypothetical protein
MPFYAIIALIFGLGAAFRHVIHALEFNPKVQYNFHRVMSLIWLIAMIVVPFLKAFNSDMAQLFIMEASLYANFATEFGAMSAALAAMNDRQTDSTLLKNDNDIANTLTTVFDGN